MFAGRKVGSNIPVGKSVSAFEPWGRAPNLDSELESAIVRGLLSRIGPTVVAPDGDGTTTEIETRLRAPT